MSSVDVRAELVRALRLDLIGPEPADEAYAREALSQTPSRWYLTGFLVPYEADASEREDETSNEQLDLGVAGSGDDEATPDPASARKAFLPSSLGVSLLVSSGTKTLGVLVTWGDYRFVQSDDKGSGSEGTPRWERTPRRAELEVRVDKATAKPVSMEVSGSDGLRLVVSTRAVTHDAAGAVQNLPKGTRAVSVFLVNHRTPKLDVVKDEALVFQAGLEVRCTEPFVPRPNLRGLGADDWDEQVADLQYRDTVEHAVGHGVSTRAVVEGGECRRVSTTWLPQAEVEKVEATSIDGVELKMEALGSLPSPEQASLRLGALVTAYRAWITAQKASAPAGGSRGEAARLVLEQAARAADRIAAGIESLRDPQVFEAFCLANRVMAAAQRQRQAQIHGAEPQHMPPPAWRPFQIAFILMSLRGIVNPAHVEREIVELLFFPTGGGKTEAYLGLGAFTLVLRRLRDPGTSCAGVSVLMRYTLRLLTLDQLSRAATLICALELERQKDVTKLGSWPFEIGLGWGKPPRPTGWGNWVTATRIPRGLGRSRI